MHITTCIRSMWLVARIPLSRFSRTYFDRISKPLIRRRARIDYFGTLDDLWLVEFESHLLKLP